VWGGPFRTRGIELVVSDFINGLFELIAGLLLLTNVWRAYKDKQVKGVSVVPTIFFTAWGLWNAAWFYPHLNQWFSFTGGLLIVFVNAFWVIQVLYYKAKRHG
jgi:hypothetical protein